MTQAIHETVHTSEELDEDDEHLLHKVKWGFIRSRKWNMLENEKTIEETIDERIVLQSDLEYLREKVVCVLTPSHLKIIRKNSDVASISMKKEVYCVRRDELDVNKFYVHALLDQHKRTIFHFTAFATTDKVAEQVVTDWIGTINQHVYDLEYPVEKLPQRRILIILNPLSGGRSGRHQFRDHVKTVLDDSQAAGDIKYTVVLTEFAGHATKICEELDLSMWDAIGCVGGDGCTHESLSGLLHRPDWRRALKIPLCPIPAGTSNALASSFYGSEHALTKSAFALVRGYQRPLDVCSVLQPGQPRYYSFLTVMFGFLANVTQPLRKYHVASIRNMIGATKEIIEMPSYRAELSYIRYHNDIPIDMDDPNNAKHQRLQHKLERTNLFRNLLSGRGIESPSDEMLSDGPPCPLLSQYYPEAFIVNKTGYVEEKDREIDPRNKEFVRVDGEFFAIQSCNVSHIAANYPLAPTTYANSEYMDMIWVRKEHAHRLDFMKRFLQLKLEERKMYDEESMDVDKTQCFKIVPLEEGSFISIDGEEAKYAATYVELHRSLGTIIVL